MRCIDPLVGVDSETELIKNGYTWPDVVIAGFCSRTAQGDYCELVWWEDLPAYLPLFMSENPSVKIVFFNGAFDINVMGRDIFIEEMKKDGRIMELSINFKIHKVGTVGIVPRRVTLYEVVRQTLGVELNKEDGTRTSFTRNMELTRAHCEYLVEDCAGTWLCGHAYNNMPTESHQARGSFVLSEISKNGMHVDVPLLRKLQSIAISRMGPLAEELRTFGFRIKQDVDKLSEIERLKRLGELVGVIGLDNALAGRKTIPKHWWWTLAGFFHKAIYSHSVLITDLKNIFMTILDRIITDPSNKTKEGKALEKQAKELGLAAKEYFREQFEPLECTDCLDGTSAKAAIVICELLVGLFTQGKLADDCKAFEHAFTQEHEYWLGWLNVEGQKPLTAAKFIQQHLRKLMQQNPGLEFEITKTSKDNVKAYFKLCAKKLITPDPEHLDSLKTYQCMAADMWRLEDVGVSDAFLEKYTEYKHLEKLLSTYLTDKYIEDDGKVHPRYDDMLVTGRTSCSAPNMINQILGGSR